MSLELKLVIETVIGIMCAVLGFFLSKYFNKVDHQASDAGKIRERIGQLEMKIDASFREIDNLKERIKELREDFRDAS